MEWCFRFWRLAAIFMLDDVTVLVCCANIPITGRKFCSCATTRALVINKKKSFMAIASKEGMMASSSVTFGFWDQMLIPRMPRVIGESISP